MAKKITLIKAVNEIDEWIEQMHHALTHKPEEHDDYSKLENSLVRMWGEMEDIFNGIEDIEDETEV